jgi:hypothetical protein
VAKLENKTEIHFAENLAILRKRKGKNIYFAKISPTLPDKVKRNSLNQIFDHGGLCQTTFLSDEQKASVAGCH